MERRLEDAEKIVEREFEQMEREAEACQRNATDFDAEMQCWIDAGERAGKRIVR